MPAFVVRPVAKTLLKSALAAILAFVGFKQQAALHALGNRAASQLLAASSTVANATVPADAGPTSPPIQVPQPAVVVAVDGASDLGAPGASLSIADDTAADIAADDAAAIPYSSPPPVLSSPTTPVPIDTIYTIGDTHGDYHCALHWLSETGLVSNLSSPDRANWEWTDPSAVLVLLGDYIDKGPTSHQTLSLVHNLTVAFGTDRVKALMGNHEYELLLDNRLSASERGRYFYELGYSTVHPDELLNWSPEPSTPEDAAMQSLTLDTVYDLAREEIYSKNKFRSYDITTSGDRSVLRTIQNATLRDLVATNLNQMQTNYVHAFNATTELGQFLGNLDVIVSVENMLFMHGGINPRMFSLPNVGSVQDLENINTQFKGNSTSSMSTFHNSLEGQVVYSLLTYRGNHESCQEVDAVLGITGADRLTVGHTPDEDVRAQCGGRFVAADSLLGRFIRTNGNQYCRGETQEVSKNGRFACNKVKDICEGQIFKMERSKEWAVEKIFSS
jgi:hypothetical protein